MYMKSNVWEHVRLVKQNRKRKYLGQKLGAM